jgi:hypothetical protein
MGTDLDSYKGMPFSLSSIVNKHSFNFNLTMEDSLFDTLLSWSTRELTEFPNINFKLFNLVFST